MVVPRSIDTANQTLVVVFCYESQVTVLSLVAPVLLICRG